MPPSREIASYPPNSTFRVWHGTICDFYETHWHTALEIVLTEQGVCECVCNGVSYPVGVDEVLIIPSGTPHSVRTPKGCHRYTIMLEMDSVLMLRDFSAIRSMMMYPIHLTHDSPACAEARALLYDIIDEYDSGRYLRELRNYGRVLELYTSIGRHYLDALYTQTGASSARQRAYLGVFNDVMEYIDAHYQEPITLEAISAFAGFSKYHFTRLFKQYANTTFYQFLSMKRVVMAERLLTTSEMTITEIALQTGFGSIPTFNRVYKQIRCCTPTDFRALYSVPLPRRDQKP